MDPLKLGPDPQRELFERMSLAAKGFPTDAVVGAAANVLLNAIRQAHPRRDRAGVAFDEMAAQLKATLMQHYNGVGERRNIFPFHQTLTVPHFKQVQDGPGKVRLVPAEDK